MSHPFAASLRRSTLEVTLGRNGLTPWPPPHAQAVPDSVVLRTQDAHVSALQASVSELTKWEVGIVLDAPPSVLRIYRDDRIDAVRCRPEAVREVAELDLTLAGTSLGIEVLAVKPAALLHLKEIGEHSPRIAAVATDPGLLREAFGLRPSTEVDILAYPRGQVVRVGRLLGVPVIGRFSLAGLQSRQHPPMTPAKYSFALGFRGGLCFSWEQVRECNEGFRPELGQVEEARRILAAMEEGYAKGLGAVSLDGRMIDVAFIPIGKRTLHVAEQVSAREKAVAKMFEEGRVKP